MSTDTRTVPTIEAGEPSRSGDGGMNASELERLIIETLREDQADRHRRPCVAVPFGNTKKVYIEGTFDIRALAARIIEAGQGAP